MVALRAERQFAQLAPFALAALFFVGGATRIGPQDSIAPPARQASFAERWREHHMGSPFGTVQAALFSLPQPLGTLVPDPNSIVPARFDPGSQASRVNRSGKGDLLIPRVQIEISADLLREDNAASRTKDASDE